MFPPCSLFGWLFVCLLFVCLLLQHPKICSVEGFACKFVCGDFIYTLEIIVRILRDVVNRERLCGNNAFVCGLRNFWGCQTPCRSNDTIYLCLVCCIRWCSDGRGNEVVDWRCIHCSFEYSDSCFTHATVVCLVVVDVVVY